MSIMPHDSFFSRLFSKRSTKARSEEIKLSQTQSEEATTPCCSDAVHIAYRGVSDDKLYMSYDRKWRDVKYFRPKGLRAFCKICRRRVY